MPYIDKKVRKELKIRLAETGGELNYLITLEMIKYFNEHGKRYQQIHDISKAIEEVKALIQSMNYIAPNHYLAMNLLNIYLTKTALGISTKYDMLAALEEARAEFRRRIVSLYEDKAIKKNGDIY